MFLKILLREEFATSDEKWEYLTKFIFANIEESGVKQFLRQLYPDWNPPKFTPQAMMPHLNQLGEEGWELVHMQPVADVGANGDVYFPGEAYRWGNAYFCVFKRKK